MKNITDKKLKEMAQVIINAIKNAKEDTKMKLCEKDWQDLEEEWFEWLHDELIEGDEPLV